MHSMTVQPPPKPGSGEAGFWRGAEMSAPAVNEVVPFGPACLEVVQPAGAELGDHHHYGAGGIALVLGGVALTRRTEQPAAER